MAEAALTAIKAGLDSLDIGLTATYITPDDAIVGFPPAPFAQVARVNDERAWGTLNRCLTRKWQAEIIVYLNRGELRVDTPQFREVEQQAKDIEYAICNWLFANQKLSGSAFKMGDDGAVFYTSFEPYFFNNEPYAIVYVRIPLIDTGS